MPLLSKAPLIEVIFEVRWGEVKKEGSSVQFSFPNGELEFFPGAFRTAAAAEGFSLAEPINQNMGSNFPHIVTSRFRKEGNTWPCFQTGLGVMTVNQINDGYNWEAFKESCLKGIEMLENSHAEGLASVPMLGVELKYQDAFIFKEGETASGFLKNNFDINFHPATSFFENPNVSNDIAGHKIAFSTGVSKPEGMLNFDLQEAGINGEQGFFLETAVRSADKGCPEFTTEAIMNWLEQAHDIQSHAFDTIINPAYAGGFK